MSYNKYGVAPREERTFRGKVYPSKAEATAARDFSLNPNLTVVEQVVYQLGCPENEFTIDFFIIDKVKPWLEQMLPGVDGMAHLHRIQCQNGYVVEVKGSETRDFRRCRVLWRKYGPVPMVVLKRKGDRWTREYVLPGEPAPKIERGRRTPPRARTTHAGELRSGA